MMRQVWSRLQLVVAQGVATLVGAKLIQAKVLDDDIPAKVKRIEPYGFSYLPHGGSQSYLVFPGGDRSFGIALIIGDEQYQMTLSPGEVAIHDDLENWVHIKRGGVIEVKASTKVIAQTPLFETSADALIGGNLVVAGRTNSNGGYYGKDGGAGAMQGGLNVTGGFTVNGKNVSDTHGHSCPACGATGGVL